MKNFITILILFPLIAASQDMTIKNVVVSIPDGIPMRVDNSLTNTGTLINHGRLIVGRNWINTGNYLDGTTGLLDLNGNKKQFIADSRGTIGSLKVSGGEKELITDLFVSNRFEMSGTKVIVSEDYGLHLAEETAFEYEVGDRVIGDLYLKGNDLTFPVGTTNQFLPVRIQLPDDQVLEMGLCAKPGKLGPAMENTLAELADFYWVLKCPLEYSGAKVELGFENASFLQQVELASVAESIGLSDSVKNAGNGHFTGAIDAGSVTSLGMIRGPYLTLARRISDNEKPSLNVLNLITPNNDGINDYLIIENIEAYPTNKVSIFDRWGVKLYEGLGYNNGDIRFEGFANKSLNRGEMESGTYFYVVSYGGEKLDDGFFELIR